jgi:hypothetical protein
MSNITIEDHLTGTASVKPLSQFYFGKIRLDWLPLGRETSQPPLNTGRGC